MRTYRFLLSLLASATLIHAFAPAADAQPLPRFGAPDPHVKAELIAATDAIVPGQPLQVGLQADARKGLAYILAGAR